MKKDVLIIENGCVNENGLCIFENIHLRVNAGETVMVYCDSTLEMDYVSRILLGEKSLDSGNIFLLGEKTLKDNLSIPTGYVQSISEKTRFIESVSIADNFFICNKKRQPLLVNEKMNQQILQDILKRFDVVFADNQLVSELNLIESYQFQLLKYYFLGVRVILLDKKKIRVSDEEFEQLYSLIKKLQDTGMSFVILENDIATILKNIDSFFWIQEGCTLMYEIAGVLDNNRKQAIVDSIFSEENTTLKWMRHGTQRVLKLENVSTSLLDNVNLKLYSSEIAVIYSESMEIQEEFLGVLKGKIYPAKGYIRINGNWSFAENQEERAREKIAIIEEFGSEGYMFDNMTVLQNYCLTKGMKLSSVWRNSHYIKYCRTQLTRILGRDAASLYPKDLTPIEALKLKYESQIFARPCVLVCVNPYSSVDRSLRGEVSKLLKLATEKGIGIIIFSRFRGIPEIQRSSNYRLSAAGVLYSL